MRLLLHMAIWDAAVLVAVLLLLLLLLTRQPLRHRPERAGKLSKQRSMKYL